MARPTSARKRGLAALLAGATAVSGAALLAPSTSSASSHREAPYIQGDPQADNTDVYAFVSPDDKDSVTLIANWLPFQEPAGGPNFFPWDPDAAYDINIDNDGDAVADLVYRWTFKDEDRRGNVQNGAIPGTFLYNNGPVTSLDDENLLFRQKYDLTVFTEGSDTGTVVMRDKPVAPSNVGVASMPDYVELRKEAVRAGTVEVPNVGRVQSYAGQADDPFFLDLRVFDLLYGTNGSERGYDTLKEYNVNTIAYKVPKRALVANGDPEANPVIGVWSTTSRKKTKVFRDTNAGPATSESDASDAAVYSGDFVQVSRLGNPLVNEVVVPAQLKDLFNRLEPRLDAEVAGGALLAEVQNPELPQLVEGIYGVRNPNKLSSPAAKDRNDLVGAFLTGFSKKQFASGPASGVLDANLNSLDLNRAQPAGGIRPAEYLRLNTAVAPTAPGRINRLGAIGGDLQGFPNGRRLQDDVVDIALQVVEGALIGQDKAFLDAVAALDGVNQNDRPFLNEFPYIADPHAGSDPRSARAQVMFKQQFSSNNGQVTTKVTGITPAAPGGFVQLYRIEADGRAVGLGSMKLNGAGTESVTKVFPARRGQQLTLNYRVFTDRRAAAESNRGVPTTITVR